MPPSWPFIFNFQSNKEESKDIQSKVVRKVTKQWYVCTGCVCCCELYMHLWTHDNSTLFQLSLIYHSKMTSSVINCNWSAGLQMFADMVWTWQTKEIPSKIRGLPNWETKRKPPSGLSWEQEGHDCSPDNGLTRYNHFVFWWISHCQLPSADKMNTLLFLCLNNQMA